MADSTILGSHSNNLPSVGNTLGTMTTSVGGYFGQALNDELRLVAAISSAGELKLKADGTMMSRRLRARMGVVADAPDINGEIKTVGPSVTVDFNSLAGVDRNTGMAYTTEAMMAMKQRWENMSEADVVAFVTAGYNLMDDFGNATKQSAMDSATKTLFSSGI